MRADEDGKKYNDKKRERFGYKCYFMVQFMNVSSFSNMYSIHIMHINFNQSPNGNVVVRACRDLNEFQDVTWMTC